MAMRNTRDQQPSESPPCGHCSTRARCLFYELPAQQAEQLMPHVRERAVAVGEYVQMEGECGPTVMVVKLGMFKGMRTAQFDQSRTIMLLGKGRLLGFNSFFRQTATLTVQAITPCRVCEVDTAVLTSATTHHPELGRRVYHCVGSYIECLADWSRVLREDTFLFKLRQALRLIACHEGSSAFRIPSHTELADLLGARRETIARHFTTLIESGRFRKVDRWHGVLLEED